VRSSKRANGDRPAAIARWSCQTVRENWERFQGENVIGDDRSSLDEEATETNNQLLEERGHAPP
jgi:hypothetical protein